MDDKKNRKPWTSKTVITDVVLLEREKKKWQVNLRRYIVEKLPSIKYAPYFGLDIENFRNWISLYFDDSLNWDNFGTEWKFSNYIPLSFFNFNDENDLKLCWYFLNIKVEKIHSVKYKEQEILNILNYFKELYFLTKMPILLQYIEKVNFFLNNKIIIDEKLINYLSNNRTLIEELKNFNEVELYKINAQNVKIYDLILEKNILKKFN